MRAPLLAAAAALLALPASAQPPPAGSLTGFSRPSILCDTSEQLQSIVDAFGDGAEAGQDRFVELFRKRNDRREPTCAIVTMSAVMTEGSTRLGLLNFAGADVYGWIVHVVNGGGEGYYLYLESPQEALDGSI
jgi:hypothetical protein